MSDRPGLVCIGNVTIDESVRPGGTRTVALGGDAIFGALAARMTGCDAEMLAPIGDDLPADLAADIARAGLSLDQPRRALPTVRNVIHYDADGGRRWQMLCSEDDFDRLSVHPEDVPDRVLGAAGVLVLAMSLRSQLTLMPWLDEHTAAITYLDLQEDYIAGNEAALLAAVGRCDVFLPSEIEALRLTGATDIEAAARALSGVGPRVVVIKRAERGCLVVEDGRITAVPVDAVVPVDPTGAGDAFCGAFAAVHSAGGDPVTAAVEASRVARIAVAGAGVTALLDAVVTRSSVR